MMVVVVRLFLLVVIMLSKMVEVMASEYDDPKDSRVKLKKNPNYSARNGLLQIFAILSSICGGCGWDCTGTLMIFLDRDFF